MKHQKGKHGTTKYSLRPNSLYNKYIKMIIINIIYTALFKAKIEENHDEQFSTIIK